MPVLGHMFVGLATARAARPRRAGIFGAALWTPILILLAYLPDITSQTASLCGFGELREDTHSLMFALSAAILLGPPLALATAIHWSRGYTLVFISALLHDFCDLFQGTDRFLLRPLYNGPINVPAVIPRNAFGEIAIFAALFLAFIIVERIVRGRAAVSTTPSHPRAARIGLVITAFIVFAAAATHYLRSVRDRQIEQARDLNYVHQYAAALDILRDTDHWPHIDPGRADYYKGVAYAGLGDRSRAEEHFRRAYQIDPANCWALADLAALSACSAAPLDQRIRNTAPMLAELRERCAKYPEYAEMLGRVEKCLATH